MIPGRMNRRITIQRFTETQNPMTGSIIKQWTDLSTVWADISFISGRELIAAQAEQSEVTVRFWIRYQKGLTTQDRILYQEPGVSALMYDITSIIPDGKRTRLEILSKGGVNDG